MRAAAKLARGHARRRERRRGPIHGRRHDEGQHDGRVHAVHHSAGAARVEPATDRSAIPSTAPAVRLASAVQFRPVAGGRGGAFGGLGGRRVVAQRGQWPAQSEARGARGAGADLQAPSEPLRHHHLPAGHRSEPTSVFRRSRHPHVGGSLSGFGVSGSPHQLDAAAAPGARFTVWAEQPRHTSLR